MAELNQTPRASRLHIGFFGKTNAGKSSIINAIVGHEIALVSEIAGTTTDPVYKSMELLPLGPVVLIDTAGLDDHSTLGKARIKKTEDVLHKTDLAVLVVRSDDEDLSLEREYLDRFASLETPVVLVINSFDEGAESTAACELGGAPPVFVDAQSGTGIEELKQQIVQRAKQSEDRTLTGHLVQPGDVVMLVMPQDLQAPKGRLILPQVQVMRDLLDNNCKVISVKTENMADMLTQLKEPPALVIIDSQVFDFVNKHLDEKIALTSFSMLMAGQKGDIETFVEGAKAIDRLNPGDHVLIAESCTHHVQKGDIARDKIPTWLEEYVGGKLNISTHAGHDFPEDIERYKLIVHCGGCMINRKNMLSKIKRAQDANVPITNFGTTIAFLNKILSRVVY